MNEYDIECPFGFKWLLRLRFCPADFSLFFFFFGSTHTCWLFHSEQCIRALFMNPQIPFFNNLFIKNEFHGTIYTFKNYFTTVFSVSAKISSIQTDPEHYQIELRKEYKILNPPREWDMIAIYGLKFKVARLNIRSIMSILSYLWRI